MIKDRHLFLMVLHSCLSTAPSGCRVRCSQELSGSEEVDVFFGEVGDKRDSPGLTMSVVKITRAAVLVWCWW